MRWGVSCEVDSEEGLGHILAVLKKAGVKNIGYDEIGKATKKRTRPEIEAQIVEFLSHCKTGASKQEIMRATETTSSKTASLALTALCKKKIVTKVGRSYRVATAAKG